MRMRRWQLIGDQSVVPAQRTDRGRRVTSGQLSSKAAHGPALDGASALVAGGARAASPWTRSGCPCRAGPGSVATGATTSGRPGGGTTRTPRPRGSRATRPEVAAVRGFLWAASDKEATYLLTATVQQGLATAERDRPAGAQDQARQAARPAVRRGRRPARRCPVARRARRGPRAPAPRPAAAGATGAATRQAGSLLPGSLLAAVAAGGRGRRLPARRGAHRSVPWAFDLDGDQPARRPCGTAPPTGARCPADRGWPERVAAGRAGLSFLAPRTWPRCSVPGRDAHPDAVLR